ncbi:Nucleotidyl transferase [Chthoniobacter flavus Ellin428]|uniref:Nucleotidyl transferase n=1 Tax=Chthoniobacter flavus Ellin428 TaxID=497964 RepID=B4D2B3_9BACT|nr:Nucleotidyl transferase [Chthoniobacter flavus Ellin428]
MGTAGGFLEGRSLRTLFVLIVILILLLILSEAVEIKIKSKIKIKDPKNLPLVIRTAFVLGAGLGTRLKSLTARRPKPLIPVANRPLITYAFDHLIDAGVERLVVNTHWRSEAYARFFPEGTYRGVPLAFRDEQPEVLETAGGIWNVRDLLGAGTFVVYNGDILSDLPLAGAIRTHVDSGNEVTMVLRSSGGPLQVAFDAATGRVTDIGGRVDAAAGPRFLFSGIYLVNAEFIARIPAATKISVVPIFCDMIRAGAKLGGIVIDEGHWWDLGNRENYLAVHTALATQEPTPWIHPTAQIAPTATISGATAIGAGARVGRPRQCK